MSPEIPPTAEGDLKKTPLAHLLVYAVDRRLTGALFLTEITGITHVVRFARGVAVKVRPGDDCARLGQLLVEEGILTEDLLSGALAAKGLLGDVLLLAGRIDRERLDQILDRQFMLRMIRLFALRPDTMYRYYDGHCELVDWGGEPASIEPCAVIWAGLKEHGPTSAKFEEALERLGDGPLVVHPAATLDRFGFDEPERAAVDLLVEKPVPLAELVSWDLVPVDTLRRLVYTLAITRQIELGTGALPVGSEGAVRQSVSTPTGGLSLGRLQLRPAVHRLGAAAPDPPGDGERAPVVAPSRRRKSSRGVSAPDPSELPPPSSGSRAASTSDAPPISGRAPAVHDGGASSPPAAAELADAAVSGEAPAGSVPPDEPAIQGGVGPGEAAPPGPAQPVALDAPAAVAPIGATIDSPELDVATAQAPVLFELALTCLAERDLATALDACSQALQVEPRHPDYLSLAVWIRSMLPGADVKALAVELDEVIQRHDAHVPARFYRGMMRRRLSDDAGAMRDLSRVLELAPNHSDAARELRNLQARHKSDPGLLARLFKR